MTKKPKAKETIHVLCAYCGKKIVVRKFEEVLEPTKKAVKNKWVTVEKDTQTKLPKGDKKA